MGLLTPILPLGVVTSCGAGSVGASDDPVSRWTTSLKVLVSACTNVVNDFESATTLFVGISMFGASNAELYVIWQSLILQDVLDGAYLENCSINPGIRKLKLWLHSSVWRGSIQQQ